MKQSGKSSLFVLICIAVLLASYGVGLGVRKVRFAGIKAQASVAPKPEKSAEKSKPDGTDKIVADAAPQTGDEPQEEQSRQEEPQEEPSRRRQRPEGGRMMGEGMRERFQNMSEEERQEMMARMRERGGRRGGGAFTQLSEEDRESLRAEMEELGARAGEMSEEEMREARGQIMEKYGITPGRFGGRPGGGGGRRGGEGQ